MTALLLPSKHLPQERALLTVGACVLKQLNRPKTVSAVWQELRRNSGTEREHAAGLAFDWFVLALDLLFCIGAIELNEGLLRRVEP